MTLLTLWHRHRLPFISALVGAMVAGMASGAAEANTLEWVGGYTFACDAPTGHTCYFSVGNAQGHEIVRLAIPGGLRNPLLLPANELFTYTVTVDRNLASDASCRSASKAGVFCKHAAVVPGTNN